MRRNRALKDARYRCSKCGSGRDPQVHHLSYERLGAELDTDLVVLCAGCHNREHIEQAQEGPNRLYLRLASEALRLSPFSTISDLVADTKDLCAKHGIKNADSFEIDRAIGLLVSTRLKKQATSHQNREKSVVELEAHEPMSSGQAREFLARLGMQALVDRHAMPKATPLTVASDDKIRAMKIIAQAMQDSIARCEELEGRGTEATE